MDNAARGSRRRHVAATTTAASPETEGMQQRPSRRPRQQQEENPDATIVTPESGVLRYSAQAAPPLRREHPQQRQNQRRNQHQHQNQNQNQGQDRDPDRAQAQEQEQVTPEISHRTPNRGFGEDGSPLGVAGVAPHPFRLHRTSSYTATRLSMPYESDDSGSEPDVSILAMARARRTAMMDQQRRAAYDMEAGPSQAPYEDEHTGIGVAEDEAAEGTRGGEGLGERREERQEEEEDGDEDSDEPMSLVDPADIGLKEISNLGRFTVSSHKPGSGVEELRSDDLKVFWQSDGPQPHKLTVYFVKRVGIRDIRFYVDCNEDESYTPTKIAFQSGTSENNLLEFASMTLDSPTGWQQVPLAGVGGEPDGNTLVSYVLQMQILENQQNGKDTHLRGIKIYAFDSDVVQAGPVCRGGAAAAAADDIDMADSSLSKDSGVLASGAWGSGDALGDMARSLAAARVDGGEAGFLIPEFMKEPEIR
ncbi:related to anaphase promoting complex subunit 10 [Claviceps purpurea 20.1]|uniref:Related to anaphase promoting complex subunit 10 n=1 Tax=Claviceps purpurea (strain 20.1) TaxID=1111077 RepID=M1W1K7_CLAP2|nr:related to anaphase promoting complex subunit 10 [Claviceps purpurea 20.1]